MIYVYPYHCGNEMLRLCEYVDSDYGSYILYLDDDGNIMLPQYRNIVIQLDPLPKSLYVLFLYHPEGIELKNISDFREELETIYRWVSRRNNPTVINRVIDEITIPHNNTIYKNISIIRSAFYDVLPIAVARHYIPLRRSGEDNLLTLDCTLVRQHVLLN